MSSCDISDYTNGYPFCYGNLNYTSDLCYEGNKDTFTNGLTGCKKGEPGCISITKNCNINNSNKLEKCIKLDNCPEINCSELGSKCTMFSSCISDPNSNSKSIENTDCYTIKPCDKTEFNNECKILKSCTKDAKCKTMEFIENYIKIKSKFKITLKNNFYNSMKCAIASASIVLTLIFSGGTALFLAILATIVYCTDEINNFEENYNCIYTELPSVNRQVFTFDDMVRINDKEEIITIDINSDKSNTKKCITNPEPSMTTCQSKKIIPSRDTLFSSSFKNNVILGIQVAYKNNYLYRISGICYTEYTNLFIDDKQKYLQQVKFLVETSDDIPKIFNDNKLSIKIDNEYIYPNIEILYENEKDAGFLLGNPEQDGINKKWLFPQGVENNFNNNYNNVNNFKKFKYILL